MVQDNFATNLEPPLLACKAMAQYKVGLNEEAVAILQLAVDKSSDEEDMNNGVASILKEATSMLYDHRETATNLQFYVIETRACVVRHARRKTAVSLPKA